ncbi:ImmA/IrrE family metallo-endopeptidase [Bacillus haynesii]|uniref:ImmA/IrrE family metallo-endopeptidase n=1 Tax=Bacillus haynesii TaxID=1925021 RepID=UPI00398B5BBA
MMYTNSHLEDWIENFYRKINITSPEQINFEYIAEMLGIRVYLKPVPSFSFKYYGKYRMVLDERKNRKEQWNDFAHELCHVLKHYGNQFIMNKMFRELQEFQANNFMYHFCIPTFMLSKISLPRLQSEAIKLIGDTFKVTYPFAAKRLEMYWRKQFSFACYEACVKQLS